MITSPSSRAFSFGPSIGDLLATLALIYIYISTSTLQAPVLAKIIHWEVETNRPSRPFKPGFGVNNGPRPATAPPFTVPTQADAAGTLPFILVRPN